MRILITTPPGLGHVQPMIPLARAIRARGHELRWATGADACRWVTAAGLAALPAGLPQGELLASFWQRHPEVRSLAPEARGDVMFPKLFGATAAPAMLTDLVCLVRQWQPDRVVHDAAEFAGPIVAAMVGVPSVVKSFGPVFPRQRIAGAADEVASLWESLGLQPRPFGGSYDYLYLDMYPEVLQPALPEYIPRR